MKPSPTDLVIRAMSRRELDIAIDWAAREGWNPGLSDAECFYGADPDGFLMAFHDAEPVATISVVRYGGQPRVQVPRDARIRAVDDEFLPAVLAYDRAFFPAPRDAFLRCWLRPDRRHALALVEDGSVRGYGT